MGSVMICQIAGPPGEGGGGGGGEGGETHTDMVQDRQEDKGPTGLEGGCDLSW